MEDVYQLGGEGEAGTCACGGGDPAPVMECRLCLAFDKAGGAVNCANCWTAHRLEHEADLNVETQPLSPPMDEGDFDVDS